MPRVTFATSSVQDDQNIAASPARLLNLYPVPVMGEGRTTYILRSVPGQLAKNDIGDAPVRAMARANDKNWLIGDGKFFEINSAIELTQRAVVPDDENTTIDGNYTDVTIVAGGNYYLWSGGLSQPTTKTFTTVGSHCYVGGYTVLTERNGKRFQWSQRGNAANLNALDFASAEQVNDNIVRAVEYQGALLILKERSIEVWQINPDAQDSAQRFFYTSTDNTGLKSFNLVTRFDDALFFVGNDNRVYLYRQGVISSPAVETALVQSTPTHCFYYEDAGAKFCVLRFSDRPAWVFDLTTRLWHERSEGPGHERWRATCALRSNGWLIGNTSGEVLELARTYQDLSAPLYRRAISSTIYLGDRKFTLTKLEALARVGDHDLTDQIEYALDAGNGFELEAAETGSVPEGIGVWAIGVNFVIGAPSSSEGISILGDLVEEGERDANLDFYISRDGARTWVGPKRRSLGRKNDFDQRMVWRAQGQAQQVTMRFDMSDPAEITLYSDGVVQAS